MECFFFFWPHDARDGRKTDRQTGRERRDRRERNRRTDRRTRWQNNINGLTNDDSDMQDRRQMETRMGESQMNVVLNGWMEKKNTHTQPKGMENML